MKLFLLLLCMVVHPRVEAVSECLFQPIDNSDCFVDSESRERRCNYCEFNLCWIRPNASFSDGLGCNLAKPNATACPDLVVPNPVPCPQGVQAVWEVPKEQLKQGEMFPTTAQLLTGNLSLVQAPCAGNSSKTHAITHVNIHGCAKDSTSWWCNQLIPAYQPSTVKTSPAQCSEETEHSLKMQVTFSNLSPPNEWTLYVHYTFWTQEADQSLSKWHVTNGYTFLVQGTSLQPSDEVTALANFFAAISLLVSLFCMAVLVLKRKHWVVIASSFEMSIIMVCGGVIGGISIYAFIPSYLTDGMCVMRVWLLPIGYDLIVIPLTLKTYRVAAIFSNATYKKVLITNRWLIKVVGGVLLFDVVYSLIWTIPSSFRLGVAKEFSTLDPNAFEFTCSSTNATAQKVFTGLAIVIRSIPLIILTFFAYRVRLSFKYAEYDKKHAEFDESLFIMLTSLNITVAGFFVIIFQSLVSAEPSAVTAMRTGGISWIIVLTMVLMFFPKFKRIWSWDDTQQVPKYTSNGTQDIAGSNSQAAEAQPIVRAAAPSYDRDSHFESCEAVQLS